MDYQRPGASPARWGWRASLRRRLDRERRATRGIVERGGTMKRTDHDCSSIVQRLGVGLLVLAGLIVADGLAGRAYAAQTLTVTDCSSDTPLQSFIGTANSESGDT